MKASLEYKDGGSAKEYHVQIVEHGLPEDGAFKVMFQYGRIGSALQVGTKTIQPVSLAKAQEIFTKLVNEKKAKGYKETGVTTAAPVGESSKEVDPDMLPQLLTEISEDEAEKYITDDDWCAQEKLDGRNKTLRKQGVRIDSANKKGQIVATPEAVWKAAVMADGFAFTVQAEHIGDVYHVHNLSSFNGDDMRMESYHRRLDRVKEIFASTGKSIRVVKTAFTAAEKRAMFKRLKKENREGICFKLKSAPFVTGHSETQKKCKFWSSLSARIRTIRPGGRESIECELFDAANGWVTCGFTTVLKRGLINTLSVGDVVELRYLYSLKGTGILYQSSPCMTGDTFKRDDVDPLECTTKQLKTKPEPKE